MVLQEQLEHISSYTGKLLRLKLGKGPEKCYAFAGGKFLMLYIHGFLSPMEEVLLGQGHGDTVDNARNVIVGGLLEELKGAVQVTLGLEVASFFHDWNYPNNRGMITAMFDQELCPLQETAGPVPDYPALEAEIARLSLLVQKVPEKIEIYRVHAKLVLAIRSGILVPIEKALINKGFSQELLVTKDELEKTYFHRDGRFQDLFRQPVQDIFIDWALREDASLLCFVLK